MTSQIFIGGVGRSGTTILGRVLSYHRDIFTYPFETRFIIDPNGVLDLCDRLSEKWTNPEHGDFAIKKFIEFMDKLYPSRAAYMFKLLFNFIIKKLKIDELISPFQYTPVLARQWSNEKYYTPFKPPFSLFIGKKEYFKIINRFLNKIIIREFEGYWAGDMSLTFHPKVIISNRFQREEICRIAGEFVNELLSVPLKTFNKSIWAEHSPPNILLASNILLMFPKAKFIHIYRDFRDVVCSYKTKKWGAKNVEDAVCSIKLALEKWEDEKKKLPENSYLEFSLENLVSNTKDTLEKICEFLNIEFDENMLKIDLSKSHGGRWKRELNKNDLDIVEKHLGRFLEEYGYE